MKSVMFSEIDHAHRDVGGLRALCGQSPVAGLALPFWAGRPGRFDVRTRFDAVHMRHTLSEVLAALGYAEASATPGQLRYVSRAGNAWRTRAQKVNVRIDSHVLEITGPIPILRALQEALSGTQSLPAGAPASAPSRAPAATGLPSRETVAGAMQISDNAGRVAGMAE